MDIMRKYAFPTICRSPDEPGAPEPEAPEVAAVADPALVAEVVDPEPDPEPTAPVAPEVPKWTLERIGEETNKRQAAEERERAAVERANSYEEIVRRLQAKEPVEPAQPAPRAQAPDQTAIEQAAARQLFQRDLHGVSEAGLTAYGPRWDEAVNALNAYGVNSNDFVASVMDVDKSKTHEIMFQIAQDGEKAVALARMTPTRRIAEITRMVMAKAAVAEPKPAAADPKPAPEPKPEPRAISRAPTPKPAIAPHAAAPEIDPTTPEGNDKMDDKQFEQWYKGKYMKRSA